MHKRRAPWFRSLAIILAAWFPLIIGEPALLQPCPMHGAGHIMAAMVHGGPTVHTMAGDDAAMAMHHHGPSQQDTGSHHCTCIDCAGIGMAVVLQPVHPLVEALVAEVHTPPALQNAASRPRPAPAYSRPYNTGPPRA